MTKIKKSGRSASAQYVTLPGCHNCGLGTNAGRVSLGARTNSCFASQSTTGTSEREMRSRPITHGAILPDGANTISLIDQDNPNTNNRSYKLVRIYSFGARRFPNFSSANAPYNFLEVGTK